MIELLRGQLVRFLLGKIDMFVSVLTDYRARLSHMDLGMVESAVHEKSEMHSKIRLLIYLRYAVDLAIPLVILLLGVVGMPLHIPERQFDTIMQYALSLWPNWIIIGTALATNAVYHYLLKRQANVRPIAYTQVWLDIVIFALIIHMTGGISSPFAFLLTLPVLASCLLLSFRAGLLAAAFSTILIGTLGWLQLKQIIPSDRYFEPLVHLTMLGSYVIAMFTLHGVLYFLIAFSSGALARTIHQHEASLARRANEATMLYEVSSSLQSTVHLDDVLREIVKTLVVRLHTDHALMYLTNDSKDGLDLKLEYFHPRIPDPPYGRMSVHFDLKREAGLTAICAMEKQAFNVTDPQNHPLINRELARKLGINPFAVAPMMARGRVIGVIGIDRRFQKAIITQEEARILAVAANQAGLTVQNAALYEKYVAA